MSRMHLSKKISKKPPSGSLLLMSSSIVPAKKPIFFDPLEQLQQTVGNHAIGRMIQTKLQVDQPGDKYEQEADHMADTIMRMPEPLVQRQPQEEEEKMLRRQPGEEKDELMRRQPMEEEDEELQRMPINEEDEELQTKATGSNVPQVSPHVQSQINSLRNGGRPLPDTARAFFEPRFGVDFGGIRIHDNEQASQLSQALGARAFTVGQEIMFGRGQYAPSSSDGRKLLAHEITHTIQQTHKLSPCVQRRALTTQEHDVERHIDEVATEANTETTPHSGAVFAGNLRDFKTALAAQITAIPPGTSDPDRLLATLWTLHAWTTVPSSYAQSRAISSRSPVRDLSSGDYKCNRFVGDAYAIGTGRGYAEHGAGGAYPTGVSPWWDPRSAYPPSANELGSSGAATGNLTNLPVTSSPQTGDIIAFPYPSGIGHSGINLGHDIYISARHNAAHPARTKQVDDGIQVTNIPSQAKQYREFKP